jgi:hypothetical protein
MGGVECNETGWQRVQFQVGPLPESYFTPWQSLHSVGVGL